MKYAFAFVFVVCCAAAGQIAAAKYKNRVKIMESFLSFLFFAESEISFTGITTAEIAEKFDRLNENALPFLKNISEPVSKSIRNGVTGNASLTAKEKEIILSFFTSFGISDELSQLNLIENSKALTNEDLKTARSETAQRVKLVTRLSFLGGLAAAVVFI